jgi:glycosyltransferase involved in cell wall biosynthesis
MIIIGGNPLSGIGQTCIKYSHMFGEHGIMYNSHQDTIPEKGDVFIFALPIPSDINKIKSLRRAGRKVHCMTICETEPVNTVYGELFEACKGTTILVSSQFCIDIFKKQFPDSKFGLMYAYVPTPIPRVVDPSEPVYTFYHIGNIMDPRKQFNQILNTFLNLKLENTRLLVKATCLKKIELRVPNVCIINGIVDEDVMDSIHNSSDCYVTFSNSEGVGMGAVEAALRDKPVIISEFGGAKEYVRTPYVIPCKRKYVGYNDFLFTPDMEWGDPDIEYLEKFMRDAHSKRLRYVDHSYTKNIVSQEYVMNQFVKCL